MNSLRPLITITILGVVGVLLYVQINKGPARHDHGQAEPWNDHAADGVPPLATTGSPATDAGTAPKWPASDAPPAIAAQPVPAVVQPEPVTAGTTIPEMPAIPALPDVSAPPQSVPPTTASSVPLNVPTSNPQSRYPDATNMAAGDTIATPITSTPDAPANLTSPDATAIDSVPVAVAQTTPPPTVEHENSIATDNAMAAVGLTTQLPTAPATPTNTNPPIAQQPAPLPDRYGLGTANPLERTLPQAVTTPVGSTFTAAWPEIQSTLDRGELARAHQLLSKWYGDSSLTPAEAEKVEILLGQLAGTVVYSTEHQLEPAYAVKQGETLEAVARSYNVPWQLLAKINGISSVDAVQPGQKLKVVRGPFSAVVDVRRSQLTLLLDGRYAGKFPITVPSGAMVTAGSWLVDQKLAAPAANVTQTSYSPAQASVERMIVLRGEDASTGKPAAAGPTLTIASGSPAAIPTAGASAIRISPQDAEELSDILSIGSRVTVRK